MTLPRRRGRRDGRTVAPRLVAVLGLISLASAAGAQAPPLEVALGPSPHSEVAVRALELTPAQRLAIYQSVTQTTKNSAAPIGFRASVGALVPAMVELVPLSSTLADLVPQAKDLRVGMVEKQVLLVDPNTREVVAVVTQEPATAVH
ncbi:MAG TPA: hypothetical protein VLX44_16685 [Xanthobacteraceae bacterium]|nr:hypothetical protein [Xanthobacteraceae bacterium]